MRDSLILKFHRHEAGTTAPDGRAMDRVFHTAQYDFRWRRPPEHARTTRPSSAGSASTTMQAAEVLNLYAGPVDTIPQLLGTRAAVVPQQSAVEFEQRIWTYAQLDAGMRTLAARLTLAGVRHGDRVAHVEANSDIAVLLFLATTALGAIFVPMNIALTDDDLAYQIGHCGAGWW